MRPCRPALLLIALITFVAGGPAPARAWGYDGHWIVGEIAWQRLTPEVRATVADLLRGDEPSLAEASFWADRIRGEAGYEWSGPLHYFNAAAGATRVDLGRDCPPQGCVVQAVGDYAAALADASAPRPERREALKFLAHFVGDLHQPLHVGYGADRGGNTILVTFLGRERKLHQVWDTDLLRHRLGWWRSWSRRRLAARLAGTVTAAEPARWQRGGPVDWAQETFDLARRYAYEGPAGEPVTSGDRLGETFYRRSIPVVEEQLQKAGVRLAALLSRALGSSR